MCSASQHLKLTLAQGPAQPRLSPPPRAPVTAFNSVAWTPCWVSVHDGLRCGRRVAVGGHSRWGCTRRSWRASLGPQPPPPHVFAPSRPGGECCGVCTCRWAALRKQPAVLWGLLWLWRPCPCPSSFLWISSVPSGLFLFTSAVFVSNCFIPHVGIYLLSLQIITCFVSFSFLFLVK